MTQVRGHIAGALLPHPHATVRAFIFCREDNAAFSCHVDSIRIVPTHAAIDRRSQQLIPFFHFCKYKQYKSYHGGNRIQGPMLVVFEGNHYYTTGATGTHTPQS